MLSFKEREHYKFSDKRGNLTILEHDVDNIKWDRTIIAENKKKHTFRGMHYQYPSNQIKYIKVIKGRIIDFIYNLETDELESYVLDSDNSLLVPSNYAHGYLTLEPNTIVSYLISGEYVPKDEVVIPYTEIDELVTELSGINNITISDKDLRVNS